MNHKKTKIEDADLAIIKKKSLRKAYSTPRLVCYGDLNELTHNEGSYPPLADFVYFNTGYTEPH
jgi:hypothetical protein